MLRKNKKYQRLIACGLLLGMGFANVNTTFAKAENLKNYEVKQVEYSDKEESNTLQPIGNGYNIKTLLEWSPESDENARYNRATIKLEDRFTGPVVNENANPEAKIMNCALTNPQSDNAPSQGGDTENAYVFSYWQYVDSYVYWGGTNRGIFLPPTPDIVDLAHKNGVPVLGTVGFPWGSGPGYVEQIREFLQKDENGNFPVADKMIEMAKFYGFDGWFINQETYGCDKADADLMVEFFTYMKEKDPEVRLGWYDSMTTDGPVRYQDALNPLNVGFFQNGDKRVTDEFFLNYNWDRTSSSFPEKSKIDMSVETAKKVGRSQYDVFAGVEVQQNAYNDKFPVEHLLDEDGKIKTSLALYCPNSTFSMAKDVDDFYKHDSKFWVGGTSDPSNTDTSEKWVGMANYVADKSAINSLPFVTNFNLGHGQKYFVDGELSRDKEWNNRAIQDYLPTWRWIVESNGSKLNPDFDRTDAYNGGSSLKVEGKLEAANPNHIKLYSTDLNITNEDTELSLVYKTEAKENNMKIGLCFGDNYDEENFEFIDIENGKVDEWNEVKIPLKDNIGRKISAISLKFESKEDIDNFKINVGNISIEEKNSDSKLKASNSITLDQSLLHNAQKAEAKIYWEDVEGAEFYEIYRRKPNGTREYIGSTYNDSYYIPAFNRYENEESFDIEVVAVDKNFNRGEGKKLKFKWNIGATDTEVPEDKKLVNLALNMPVTVSSENAGEPGYKAVDGTADNNSKWCTTTGIRGAWLTVDLGEEKSIQRWLTMHGEAGGEDKLTNTDSFRLQVSSDGINFKDIDKVVGNEEGIVDRNLESPITGRYFRIVIDDPGKSPWAAVRLYEFQLFEDKYISKTNNIPLNSVKAFNEIGANDKIVVKNLKVGQEISFYKNIDDKDPFLTKISDGSNLLTIDNLDLGIEEGRVFFAIKEEGKEESIKLSTSYENEKWNRVEIPNNFKIKEYEVAPRAIENGYYGTLEIGELEQGDIINLYKADSDIFPTRVSVAAENDKTVLERLELSNTGGEIILEVQRPGMKSTGKFKLAYNEAKEASSKGTVQVSVQDSKNGKTIDGAEYEILKEGNVLATVTTNSQGNFSYSLIPGNYQVRYTGNVKNYPANDKEYDFIIGDQFEVVNLNLSLNKNGKIEKPNSPRNLVYSDLSSDSLVLNWNHVDNVDISEYVVYKDGKEYKRVKNNQCLVTDLKVNTIYGFKVVAIGEDGQKSKATSINIRTLKNSK